MCKIQTVYLPYKGGSIYGKGIIREKDFDDNNVNKYIFENERGKIYFDSFNDNSMKGVELIFTPEQLNEYTQSIIKQTSVEFANWIAYTKKHGGVKPLQEALIQYKLKSTEELFDKYLEMSK